MSHSRGVNGSKAPAGGVSQRWAELRRRGGRGGAHREELRVVHAADREVEPVGEVVGRARAVVVGLGLGHEPQQRGVVAGQRGAHRCVQLAVDHRVRARVLHHVHERPHVHARLADAAAVGVARGAGDRLGAQAGEQLREARGRAAGSGGGAARRRARRRRPSRAGPPRRTTRTRGRGRAPGRRSRGSPSAAGRRWREMNDCANQVPYESP